MAKKDKEPKESAAPKQNASHFEPQAETGIPARPDPIDPSHTKPQAEPKHEERNIKVSDPSHLEPQK